MDVLLEQIIKVRDTGFVNMFDCRGVRVVADKMGLYELVCFIEEHPKEYSKFILTGWHGDLEVE